MKKILISLMLVCSIATFVGCGSTSSKETSSNNNETKKEELKKEEPKKEEVKKSNLDRLKEEFKSIGEIGDNQAVAYSMLGANNGYKFNLNGGLIEIYEYDLNNLSEEGKKFVEQAKNGSVSMSGINIPVKYNNGMLLVRYNEHKDKEKILEKFNNFK